MAQTRRQFLGRIAAAGGAPLVYEAMTGLGLLAVPTQGRFELRGQVSAARVVILGAGLAHESSGIAGDVGRKYGGAA